MSEINPQKLHQRFDGLDAVKTICAILIVIIHVNSQYISKNICSGLSVHFFSALARVGVPVFFMITGFFFQSLYDRKKLAGYFKRIAGILIYGLAFYLLLGICFRILRGYDLQHAVTERLSTTFDILSIERCLAFPATASHLWYLISLVNALLIVWVCEIAGIRRKMYWVIPVLLTANYLIATFSDGVYVYYRNFLFTGLPYLLIGCLIFDYKERLLRIFTPRFTVAAIVVSVIILAIEVILYGKFGFGMIRDHYLSTTFTAIALFMLGLNPAVVWHGAVSLIGNIYSTQIYVYHLALISVFSAIGLFGKVHFLLATVIVFMLTLISVVLFKKTKLFLSEKRKLLPGLKYK